MTNEEAIKELEEELKDSMPYRFDPEIKEYTEALELAIKALKEIDDIKEAYRIMRGDL